MREYSVPIENGMRVRHDAKARFTVKAGRVTLEDDLTPVESLGGAITRAGIMYNRLSYSGGVEWYNPETGMPVSKPTYQMRVRASDILIGSKECTCDDCSKS